MGNPGASLNVDTAQLLPNIFDERAISHPDGIYAKIPISSTSYKDGFRTITNLQFANAVNHVAWLIDNALGRSESFETLAYIGPNDPRNQIIICAGMKTGYKTFLPSPRNSKIAQVSLLSRLECTKLAYSDPEAPSIPVILEDYDMQKLVIPSMEELYTTKDVRHYPYGKKYSEERHNPMLVLHTSGSTGIPKPLIYTSEFIERFVNLSRIPAPEGYTMTDSVWRTGPIFTLFPSFHMGQLGLTLLNTPFYPAAFPVYPLPSNPPTCEGFIEVLDYVKIDMAYLPPPILDDLVKDASLLNKAVTKLKYIGFAGSDLSRHTGDTISQKIPVHQIFGSSECGLFPMLRPVDDHTLKIWNDFEVHPVANVEFRHRYDDLYELVSVRKAESEKYQPHWILFPDLKEYETKDLFAPHPTKRNVWHHRARLDDIIVFSNGEKTNPTTFEADVESEPEVRSALVIGQGRLEAALLVELRDTTPLQPEDESKIIDRLWPVVQKANGICPAHARVARSRIMLTDPSMPMLRVAKGSVQRAETLKVFAKKIDELYEKAEAVDPVQAVNITDKNSVIRAIQDLVRELTGWVQLDDDEIFFFLGMDSLQVLQLERKLRAKFPQRSFTTSTIYKNPSVNALSREIMSVSHANGKSNTNGTFKEVSDMLQKYEAQIDKIAISAQNGHKDDVNGHGSKKTIILTGSTGALGSHLLNHLLGDDSVEYIYCFNRSADSKSLQVIRSARRQLATDFPDSKVTFLVPNLTEPKLGLEDSIYEKLSSSVTHIIHNAWPVDFNWALQSFQPSLDEVMGLISFAFTAKSSPTLLFLSSISSASNYPTVSGKNAPIPEAILTDDASPERMGYGQSKYLAERILNHAVEKLHISAAAVRIGQIAGIAGNPRGWNRHEWFPSLVISSRYIGAIPDSLGTKTNANTSGLMGDVNWVPVDQLADVLVELAYSIAADTNATELRIFHTVNPHPVAWENLLPTVKSSLKDSLSQRKPSRATDIEVLPYPAWLERLQESIVGADGSERLQKSSIVFYLNPGIKLLDFYRSLDYRGSEDRKVTFALEKTMAASRSLRNLQPIEPEWIAGWIQDWLTTIFKAA